ncbi:MAG: hypothetical protein MUC41_03270 [Syntrophobacteraceae bacterium]|jgi:hypothetical protein|nr:hypothetical protein [Syntrophobacteraceae bacterium]
MPSIRRLVLTMVIAMFTFSPSEGAASAPEAEPLPVGGNERFLKALHHPPLFRNNLDG